MFTQNSLGRTISSRLYGCSIFRLLFFCYGNVLGLMSPPNPRRELKGLIPRYIVFYVLSFFICETWNFGGTSWEYTFVLLPEGVFSSPECLLTPVLFLGRFPELAHIISFTTCDIISDCSRFCRRFSDCFLLCGVLKRYVLWNDSQKQGWRILEESPSILRSRHELSEACLR